MSTTHIYIYIHFLILIPVLNQGEASLDEWLTAAFCALVRSDISVDTMIRTELKLCFASRVRCDAAVEQTGCASEKY